MAKKDQYISPVVIFLLYIVAAFGVICGYRFISPPRVMFISILDNFQMSWRFSTGIITFIHLFPALAFSGLVIPFGLKEHSEGGYAGTTFVGKKGFSAVFLKYLSWPVITASAAAIIYGILFFLVLPLALNQKTFVLDRSELFEQAWRKAEAKAMKQEWAEASQFIDICERIWPGSRNVEELKKRFVEPLDAYNKALITKRKTPEEVKPIWEGIPGNPVDSAEAFTLAEKAFEEERYYDAHWLATLTQRIAAPGAAEISAAVTLASKAWEKISALEPNTLEKERYSLYHMKRDGYEAMNAGDWISAFYTFQKLSDLTPSDPDIKTYLKLSEEGVAQMAFFIDELDLSVGITLTKPVFSLPGDDGIRYAIYFTSLALLEDYTYAWGTEVVAAGREGRFRFRVNADYAKLIPINSGSTGTENSGERTVLLFNALDRANQSNRIEPVWTKGEDVDQGSDLFFGANQIMLAVSYDDFLLLSRLKEGAETLNLRELFYAEKKFADYGYIRESFRAEILSRLGEVMLFLPMAILALILGWRYRARKKPQYVYVPMLALLPLVFYGVLLFYRNIISNISIWLSLSMKFSTALICLCVGAGVFFILTLVVLSAQHG